MNYDKFNVAQVLQRALTSIIVYVLLIRTVLNLQMPLKKKIMLVAMFGMGGLTCIASIMRAYKVIVN